MKIRIAAWEPLPQESTPASAENRLNVQPRQGTLERFSSLYSTLDTFVKADNEVTDYWFMVFNTSKISLRTSQYYVSWLVFIVFYGFFIALPACYPFAKYASLALNTRFNLSLSKEALAAVSWLANGAALTPAILATAYSCFLLASIIRWCNSIYALEGNIVSMLQQLPRLMVKKAIPLSICLIAALASGNIPYECFKETNINKGLLYYLCATMMIANATADFGLMDELVIKPWIGWWRANDSLERQTLLAVQTRYFKQLEVTVKAVTDQLAAPILANALSEKFWQHFCAMRSASSSVELLTHAIHFCDEPTNWREWACKPVHYSWADIVKTIIFIVFSLIYSLPSLMVGLTAESFVKQMSGLNFPGVVLGTVFYGVSGIVNFYGMRSLWDYGVAFQGVKLRCHKDSKDCQQRLLHIALNMLKALLIVFFVLSEVAYVLAFPLRFNTQYDLLFALLQLIVTLCAATGFALFSVNKPFEKGFHYCAAWQNCTQLQSSVLSPLTKAEVHVMHQYLQDASLSSAIACAPMTQVQKLYRQLDVIDFQLENGVSAYSVDIPNDELSQALRSTCQSNLVMSPLSNLEMSPIRV